MVVHTWITRGKHTCGYVWTTPASPSVVCACGGSQISANIPFNLDPVVDEQEFAQAVADDLSVPVGGLLLQHGEE